MLDDVQNIELTKTDLDLIEGALATQEKILAVQARAGGRQARGRLNDLKGLMRRLRRQVPDDAPAEPAGWARLTRSFSFMF